MYRVGKYSAQAIGFYELFEMNLDEIILLDRMKANSIKVRTDLPIEYNTTMYKCFSIHKRVIEQSDNRKNQYYSHQSGVPITVGELLKVFSFEGGYKDIEKHIEKSPKLNEDEFKNIYNGCIKYVSLDEEDIIKINAIKNYRQLADARSIESIVQFYSLCNKLKNVVRSGWKNWNVERERVESVAEHIYGMQMLALAMYSQFSRSYLHVDIAKACMMIAIHELGKIVIGDLTVWDIDKDTKAKKEREAVSKILGGLLIEKEIMSLYDEFEARKTPTANFVYQCDKLECDLQCKMYDEEGTVDLNNQEDNLSFQDPKVQELLEQEGSWSNMWMQFGLDRYPYDDNFRNVSQYVKKRGIKKDNK